jgi:hypothetical protein
MPVLASHRALTRTPGARRANCASKPIAAAEFGTDKIAVFAKSLAQCGDLNFQVILCDNDAWPRAAEEPLVTSDPSASSKTRSRSKARVPNSIGIPSATNLAAAQQYAELAEFECCIGCGRARPGRATRQRVFLVRGGLGVGCS